MHLLKAALTAVGLGNVSLLGLAAGALGILSALAALWWAIDGAGYARAKAQCDTATLTAALAAKQAELDAANGRLARSESTVRALMQIDADARERIAKLATELATRPLQSTKPGAKPDANALLDDRCNLTPAGAARLRQRLPARR